MRPRGAAAARQEAALQRFEHRPWPLPRRRWVIGQTWTDLLFANWRLRPARIASMLPPGLQLDIFDGEAWLTVTPLRMSAVRLRGAGRCPPGVRSFLELNVRTYASLGGRPGVFFFSLDAGSPFAVRAARLLYRLPYSLARMSAVLEGGAVDFSSERTGPRGVGAAAAPGLRIRYRAADRAPFAPVPGTLEHFLTERYCLYTADRNGKLFRAEIHHPPWSLLRAEVDISRNTMAPAGIDLPARPDVAHCGGRQDVVVWRLERSG